MRFTLLFTLLSVCCCNAQVNLKMNVNSSFRETNVIRNIDSTDVIIDNSVSYEVVFTNIANPKILTSGEVTEYSSFYKGTPDSIFINKNDKKKINLSQNININTFHQLFDLFKKESDDNFEEQEVLSTPYDISMELIYGNDTINIKRKEHPADYVNHWYCDGKKVFNPKIDQIIVEILPEFVLGNYEFIKIPSKKTIKFHRDELNDILNQFTNSLKAKDTIKIKALAYEIFPTINTVRYFEDNKLYNRGIPEIFQNKSEKEIKVAMKNGREAYASSFLRLLNEIDKDSDVELLTNSEEINIEYAGFLIDFRGFSRIIVPRGNGAIESTHFYFKLKINNEVHKYSFGEMLRVNDKWLSFTSPRIE